MLFLIEISWPFDWLPHFYKGRIGGATYISLTWLWFAIRWVGLEQHEFENLIRRGQESWEWFD